MGFGHIESGRLKVIHNAIENLSKSIKKSLDECEKEKYVPSIFEDTEKTLNEVRKVIKPSIDQESDFHYTTYPFSDEMKEIIKYSLNRYKQDLIELKAEMNKLYTSIPIKFENTDREIDYVDQILGYAILK